MGTGTKATKRAIYTAVTGDAQLMAFLGGRGPYPGRLPEDAPHSETVAAITLDAETSRSRGRREVQTFTLSVWAYRMDLVEDTVERLRQVLDALGRGEWKPYAVTGAVARGRWQDGFDLADETSDLFRQVVRFRVLYAAAVA